MSNEEKSVSLEEASEAIKESEKEVALEEEQKEEVEEMAQAIFDPNEPIITIKKLIEGDVHYGHPTRRWNPKMKQYIFCARNGIYLIDLVKTKEAIINSYNKIKQIVSDGGKVLLVGTKQVAKELVKEEAERSGSFYITNRWLGGTLTNFRTIQLRIKRLKELEQEEIDGTWDNLPKKEVAVLRKEKDKLSKNLEGIKEMRKLPSAMIIIDPMSERIALKEANKLHIPTFALCDTNCDPDGITNVIAGNNEAQKSIQLLVSVLVDAIVEAKGGLPVVAYSKDESQELSMEDAVKKADLENALRIAERKEMLKARLEKEKAKTQPKFVSKGNYKKDEKTKENKDIVKEINKEEKVETKEEGEE